MISIVIPEYERERNMSKSQEVTIEGITLSGTITVPEGVNTRRINHCRFRSWNRDGNTKR